MGVFVDRCRGYFVDGGTVVDQPFASRLSEGLIRAYLSGGVVVGYARQFRASEPIAVDGNGGASIFGMPSAKTMFDVGEPQFERLRTRLEAEWVPGMCALVGLDPVDLPMLWDADFLYGPPDDAGEDTYLLCEINASSVLPFPPAAPDAVARAVVERLTRAR